MSDDKALAEREETGVAAYDPTEFAGAGFDNQTADDLQMPMLDIIQSNSPQLKKENEKFIEGAQQGQIFNTVTNKVLGEEIEIIPVIYTHATVEWRDRKHGGGFIASHDPKAALVIESVAEHGTRFGKIPVKGNPQHQLVETIYLYAVVPGQELPVIIPFTSTKIPVFKKFNTRYTSIQRPRPDGEGKYTPPFFQHRVRLGVRAQSNTKGDFYNYTLTPAIEGDIDASMIDGEDPRFAAAVKVYQLVKKGELAVNLTDAQQASEGDADGGGAF